MQPGAKRNVRLKLCNGQRRCVRRGLRPSPHLRSGRMMLWTAAFLDPGWGRIGRRSLWLHKVPPLMKGLAQQLRRPEHGNQHIYPSSLHLIQLVLQPVASARTRNDGQAKLIASFNPVGFHTAILPCSSLAVASKKSVLPIIGTGIPYEAYPLSQCPLSKSQSGAVAFH